MCRRSNKLALWVQEHISPSPHREFIVIRLLQLKCYLRLLVFGLCLQLCGDLRLYLGEWYSQAQPLERLIDGLVLVGFSIDRAPHLHRLLRLGLERLWQGHIELKVFFNDLGRLLQVLHLNVFSGLPDG